VPSGRDRSTWEKLGHNSIAITKEIYSFAMPNMQQDAVDRVDETLQKAIRARNDRE
jgi:hypothetical protein